MSGRPGAANEPTNIQWSRQETTCLIHMYRQQPCLWNVKSVAYKDRNKHVVALTAITKEMQKMYVSVTTVDIKRKIDTLRNQYRHEMRLEENSCKSGAATDDVYSPKLWCFDDLSFSHLAVHILSAERSSLPDQTTSQAVWNRYYRQTLPVKGTT